MPYRKKVERLNFNKPKPGQSLAEKYPKLLEEWDYLLNTGIDPAKIPSQTHHDVWWKCRNNKHESYSDSPHDRTISKDCPICLNKRVLVGFNDFASQYPELLKEWDYEANTLSPDSIVFGDTHPTHWKCRLRHTWKSNCRARVDGKGCAFCAGAKIWTGYNDFATKYPDLVKYYDSNKNLKSANEIASQSGSVKFLWICELGHSFAASTSALTRKKGIKCSICSNRELLVGFNDLKTKYPNLAAEFDTKANGITPDQVKFNLGLVKFYWTCKNGHTWLAALQNRVRLGVECGICSHKIFLKGYNDLATLRPDLAEELYESDVNAEDIPFGNPAVYNWICSKGHIWPASVAQRCHNNSGCMTCSDTNTSSIEKELRRRLSETDLFTSMTQIDNHRIELNWRSKTSMRVDFYGIRKGKPVVIEYDSFRYLENKVEIDRDKALALLGAGYTVMRLRGRKLKSLKIKHKNYLEILDVNLTTSGKYDSLVMEIIKSFKEV
jgi:very-short-patch-repair endonuclease/DNA-directed RNA polymerase subunit RPC12/RpoP